MQITPSELGRLLAEDIRDIARVCHEANRAWCHKAGDHSQVSWDEAPLWQTRSVIDGVIFVMSNPDAPASANHENWSKVKIAGGWVYGETKDVDAKTHPCLVPFDQLPAFQQKKDILFRAIVKALS